MSEQGPGGITLTVGDIDSAIAHVLLRTGYIYQRKEIGAVVSWKVGGLGSFVIEPGAGRFPAAMVTLSTQHREGAQRQEYLDLWRRVEARLAWVHGGGAYAKPPEKAGAADAQRKEKLTGFDAQAMGRPAYGVRRDVIRVPTKPAILHQWRVIWGFIRPQWGQGRTYQMISEWLNKAHPDVYRSPDVVKDIVKAGLAGELD